MRRSPSPEIFPRWCNTGRVGKQHKVECSSRAAYVASCPPLLSTLPHPLRSPAHTSGVMSTGTRVGWLRWTVFCRRVLCCCCLLWRLLCCCPPSYCCLLALPCVRSGSCAQCTRSNEGNARSISEHLICHRWQNAATAR